MGIATHLISPALTRIGDLAGDDAKETALRALVEAVDQIDDPGEEIADAFARVLSMARALAHRPARTRVFLAVCGALTDSPLPLARRRELLDRALEDARAAADPMERVECATAVIEALVELRSGEPFEEMLAALLEAARAIEAEEERTRAEAQIAGTLAKLGEMERAREVALALPLSGRRALARARLSFALEREGSEDEAAVELDAALDELRELDSSYDKALALRHVLARVTSAGPERAVSRTLSIIDSMDNEPRFQRDALAAAVEALPHTALEGEDFDHTIARLGISVSRIGDMEMRAEMLGSFARSLAALGELGTCLLTLGEVVDLAWPISDLAAALPIPAILGTLADAALAPQEIEQFAARAFDLLGRPYDEAGVGALVREMARFFASPALPYPTRLSLFNRALWFAQHFEADNVRIELVANIADGLSIAGATEIGDALFAGLTAGIGHRAARPVRLSRAVALVRLGRTADARAELAAAAASTGDAWHAIEQLTMAMARCGFLADMLAELMRLDGAQRPATLAQLADTLVEADHLDPHLRDVGLTSLLDRAEGPVRDTIACLLDQLRLLEGIGDPDAILEKAFARTAALENREAAAIFEQQLVGALIERIGVTAAAARD
jgi:hypothetical protein